ncbi:hypothetical protein [Thaumasiovibrio subtropicus]|uniref:hypothetical protein n=1 Tax=Thaumasiovibrio subtropicus TaxID=1891207 RepID=UPI000B363E7D|nr:hypothetical protein [Thaumasiovibrio subtropicus]
MTLKEKYLIGASLSCLFFSPTSLACMDEEYNAHVTYVYVEEYTQDRNPGQILKQHVDALKRTLSGPEFERHSAINTSISFYDESEGVSNLILTLSASYTGAYEAVTELIRAKGHVSIDIGQCIN